MNSTERTQYLYHAMAEMIEFLDPKGNVTIEVQDAYGAMISFSVDETTETKMMRLLVEHKFTLTDSDESFSLTKDYDEFGATVVVSKSKSNPKMNMSITV